MRGKRRLSFTPLFPRKEEAFGASTSMAHAKLREFFDELDAKHKGFIGLGGCELFLMALKQFKRLSSSILHSWLLGDSYRLPPHSYKPEELDAMLERLGVSDPDTRQEQAPLLLSQFDTSGSGAVTFEMFASVAEGL